MEITPANLELANKLLKKAFPGHEPFKIETQEDNAGYTHQWNDFDDKFEAFKTFEQFELTSDSMPFRIYTDTDMADFIVCEEIDNPGCYYLSNGDPGYPDDSEIKEHESFNHFTSALFNVFTRELGRLLLSEIEDFEPDTWEFDE